MWTNVIKNLLNMLLLENGLRQTGRCAVIRTDICNYNSSSSSSSSSKGKAIPLQTWTGPEGSRRLRLPDFKTIGTLRW